MEKPKIIVNADDFGVSPGVNKAVIKAFKYGTLNSASLMVNAGYAGDAIKLSLDNPKLSIGLHINLTNESALSDPGDIPLLVNKKGQLKNGYVKLLLLSFFKPLAFKRQVRIEIRRQIGKMLGHGIKPSHLDSHRHVHTIPSIFSICKELDLEFNINRIRIINESFGKTFFTIKNPICFIDGGVIKYLVTKIFYYINNTKSDTYFYGIIYPTKLFGKNVSRILVPNKFKAVEIAVHPSCIEEDKKIGDSSFKDYLLYSPNRTKELVTIMDKDFVKHIIYET